MSLVLGIDAAWTPQGSSGVCLLRTETGRNTILRAASSYATFLDPAAPPNSSKQPNAAALLKNAEEIAGAEVDVVAIDMPLSRNDITGRRSADNAISREFGRAWAGTHSPTPSRPGMFGSQLCRQFEGAGYTLRTGTKAGISRALIEVYPLAALVSFLELQRRPEYKIGRIRRYWREHSTPERIELLVQNWRTLRDAMAAEIDGIPAIPTFDEKPERQRLKQYEDQFDAILCAWIGACFIGERVRWFGDDDAAICIPLPG